MICMQGRFSIFIIFIEKSSRGWKNAGYDKGVTLKAGEYPDVH